MASSQPPSSPPNGGGGGSRSATALFGYRPSSTARRDTTDDAIEYISLTDLLADRVPPVRLGAGGGGEVFRMSWHGTPVAVKLFSPECACPSTRCQFPEHCQSRVHAAAREAQLQKRAADPRVVAAYGFTAAEQQPVPGGGAAVTRYGLVMELLPLSLDARLREAATPGAQPPFTLSARLRVLLHVAGALARLHGGVLSPVPPPGTGAGTGAGAGVGTAPASPPPATQPLAVLVHGDVKPQNVLLTSRDNGTLGAKLSDFGLACMRRPDTNSTIVGGARGQGTFEYCAPELMHVDPTSPPGAYTPASDAFAFGMLAYETLTGQRPWQHLASFRAYAEAALAEAAAARSPGGGGGRRSNAVAVALAAFNHDVVRHVLAGVRPPQEVGWLADRMPGAPPPELVAPLAEMMARCCAHGADDRWRMADAVGVLERAYAAARAAGL